MKRGFFLTEVLLALLISSTLLLAAGTVLQRAVWAQKRAEAEWNGILACRTVLEMACAVCSPTDTVWTVDGAAVHAVASIESLQTGELVVRARSWWESRGVENNVTLVRLVWPGKPNYEPDPGPDPGPMRYGE